MILVSANKYVGIQRIHRAILNLPRWRALVNSQAAMHLWPFLTAKYYGVTTGRYVAFGEQKDRAFWNQFMRVRDTSYPYYDPLEADYRIDTHYHSNVATARKNTFSNRWRAASYTTDEQGQEHWKFEDQYLQTFTERVLTKAGITTKVPIYDVLSWLYRTREFPESITLDKLISLFCKEFNLTKQELSAIFSTNSVDGAAESDGRFFADHPSSPELILAATTQKESFDLSDNLAEIQPAGEVQSVNINDVLHLVKSGRRQIIFQGPPGTGKTYMARQVAALLLNAEASVVEQPEGLSEFLRSRQYSRLSQGSYQDVEHNGGTWDIVQFHPSYTYEDFVRGITATLEGGTPVFEVKNRIFGELADLSEKVSAPVVLIVDEINRGDLSKVLGELIYALEYRSEPVRTPYLLHSADAESALISVAKNLYLLATMNTADRSIALIDYAIRRRFDFVELHPNRDLLLRHLTQGNPEEHSARILELYDAVTNLFGKGSDFAVGHAYFMSSNTETVAQRMVFQVLPLLAEYQKEGVLEETASVVLDDWPGETGLPLRHPRPFLLAAELKTWLDGGDIIPNDEVGAGS